MEKHPLTGCRPAQLVGVWAIEPLAFGSFVEQAMAALGDGQLEVLARQSRELVDEERAEPYQLDSDGIAHLSVTGPMTRYPHSMQALTGGTSTLLMEHALRRAAADPEVKGAILHVDSPGGHASCAADVASAIRAFRASKPVAAHVNGMGTSLAYRVAIEADHVSIDPAGVTGSVGTMLQLRDTSEVFKRAGVKPHYIATGDRKAIGATGTPITDDHVAELSRLAHEVGQSFNDAVKERRPGISAENLADVFRAGLYAAPKAKEIGLVDSVCDTAGAIDRFKQQLTSSPGSSGRALPAVPSPGAAPQARSVTMLTDEQLTQARALPGCEQITAENAGATLLAAAQSLHAAAQDRGRLADELAQLKASTKAPDKAVLKAMAGAAGVHAMAAVNAQAITPAVRDALVARLVGEGESLNATALAPDAGGECIASAVFAALAGNGRMPDPNKDAPVQPAPKAVPGAPGSQQPVTEERKKELLRLAGASA
jgi:signal peptide peptidase SppA